MKAITVASFPNTQVAIFDIANCVPIHSKHFTNIDSGKDNTFSS